MHILLSHTSHKYTPKYGVMWCVGRRQMICFRATCSDPAWYSHSPTHLLWLQQNPIIFSLCRDLSALHAGREVCHMAVNAEISTHYIIVVCLYLMLLRQRIACPFWLIICTQFFHYGAQCFRFWQMAEFGGMSATSRPLVVWCKVSMCCPLGSAMLTSSALPRGPSCCAYLSSTSHRSHPQ